MPHTSRTEHPTPHGRASLRKWLLTAGLLALVAVVGFFGIAPGVVEGSMNVVAPVPAE
jgi:hypothetical protein